MNAQTGYRRRFCFSSKPSSLKHGGGGDRFIPNRSAMDFDIAHYMLTAAPINRKEEEKNSGIASKEKGAYMQILDRVLLQNRTRILAFNSRHAAPAEEMFPASFGGSPSNQKRTLKRQKYVPQLADRILDAPDMSDDFYLNLLDWGKRNVLAVALGYSVYLWDASVRSASEFVMFDDDLGPVTSVGWAPDGQHIAIGLNSSHVQLWDATSNCLLRTFEDVHHSRVGSLAWNGSILSTGGLDGKIVNSDVRIRSHIVQTYAGHRMEVCGLKWSGSGQQLEAMMTLSMYGTAPWLARPQLQINASGSTGLINIGVQLRLWHGVLSRAIFLPLVVVRVIDALGSGTPSLGHASVQLILAHRFVGLSGVKMSMSC